MQPFLADVLALADEEPDALGDLLDGFALTVLIAVAVGTIYYAMRVVNKLRRSISGDASPPATGL